jgi:hypothetical protein
MRRNVCPVKPLGRRRYLASRPQSSARTPRPICCPCGQLLPRVVTPGRPPLTCGERCRRARRAALFKIARRREWLRLWESAHGFRRRRIAAEVSRVRWEIAELHQRYVMPYWRPLEPGDLVPWEPGGSGESPA